VRRRKARRLPLPWRWVWIAAGLVALGVGLTTVSCYSSRKASTAGNKPTPRAQRDSVATPGALEVPVPGEPNAAVAPLVSPPPANDDSGLVYDPDYPCMTRGQARRVRTVLLGQRNREDIDVWVRGLNEVMHELKVDCSRDDFLLLAVTTIQMESNVRVDPAVATPNLEQMYAARLKHFRSDHIIEALALNLSGLDDQLRAKLRRDTRKGKVRTEADLDRYVVQDLRPWLLTTLQTDYHVPERMAQLVVSKAVPDPVRTIGPMQVDVYKAYRNAVKRGEHVPSVETMKGWLFDPQTALKRGLKEGTYLLHINYGYYAQVLPPDQAVLFSAADYNAGEFSSRNAAFQERVSILTGRKLVLDGDLLLYQNGEAEAVRSKTESGVLDVLQGELSPAAVRRDLLLDKEPGFENTATAKAICARFESRRKTPCAPARLPIGAVNPSSEDKWGRTLTPADYAYGYQKRFRANRMAYDGASALPADEASLVGPVQLP
jgi:hypothetical protein